MEKKMKRIEINWIEWIVEFYEERAKLGERVQEITYKEDDRKFSFHNGKLSLTPFTSNISSFRTISKSEFEGEEVEVVKTYVWNDEEVEFIVHSKSVRF